MYALQPDNPEGTSSYIGMHRDGEDTLGSWARDRRSGIRRQQLTLVGSARGRGVEKAGGLRSGVWAEERRRGGRDTLRQQLDDIGGDITDVGESNRDSYVTGANGM